MANVTLKDVTMERVRVEEYENQRMKIVNELILFFSRISFSKFFLEALYISWV